MKIRHVYSKGLITNAKEEQNNKQRQFSADSFFRQLSSRNDFVNNNAMYMLLNKQINTVKAKSKQFSNGFVLTQKYYISFDLYKNISILMLLNII